MTNLTLSPVTKRPRVTPYHSDLNTPLLTIGNEVWNLGSACQGTVVLGGTGAGKTSGSGRAIQQALLKSGAGGCVLISKIEEAPAWIEAAKSARRERDLVVVDASGKHRFNILDYAAKTLGGDGFEQNISHLMGVMVEATRINSGSGGGDGDNSYFVDGALKWLAYAFPLLWQAEGTLRMSDLSKFIVSLPKSMAETFPSTLEEEKLAAKWMESSYCAQVHMRAGDVAATTAPGSRENRIVREYGNFFLNEVAQLSSRTRSSIESTLTNMIYPFLVGKLAELFCTDTTFTPESCRDEGKLIILNLPVLEYGPMGAVAQSLFKYLFGIAAQRTKVDAKTRPIFCFADECQFYLSEKDAEILSTARSSKTIMVYMTQDLETFWGRLGSEKKDTANSIFAKFGTRIIHATTSRDTALAISEIIGKVEKFHMSKSHSSGRDSGVGGDLNDKSHGYSGSSASNISTSESTNGYMDYEIPPDYFAAKLRTGGRANNFKVDAIVITNGRIWKRTKRHWIQAEFSQK